MNLDEQLDALDTCKNCGQVVGMLIVNYPDLSLVQRWTHFINGEYQDRCEEAITVAEPVDPYKYLNWIPTHKDY